MARLHTDHVELKYTLTFTMPFHFGTGLRSGLLDRTIVRNQDGYVYVPASTIKGVWREKCEQLERLYTGRLDLVDTPHNAKKALLGLGNTITMTTRIFGSQQHPGHLFFEDAHLTKEEKEELDDKETKDKEKGKGRYKYLQTSNYTQVRLERPSRTSIKGALYTSEFGVSNFFFEGSVNGWLECMHVADFASPEPTCSLQLLLAGLCMLERLGGNKSTGKGACECKITSLRLNDTKVEESDWQGWLEHLDMLELYEYVVKEEGL